MDTCIWYEGNTHTLRKRQSFDKENMPFKTFSKAILRIAVKIGNKYMYKSVQY